MDKSLKESMMNNKVEFYPLVDGFQFTDNVTVSGLILPDETKLINFAPCSGAVWHAYQEMMKAKTFTIRGERKLFLDLTTLKVIGE